MPQLIDLGKLRFNFAGPWSEATAYERNDVVKYGGNIYCYVYPLTEAARLPTNTIYWALMVKGIDFQGVFAVATPYKIGDGVAHGGKVYVAIADSTGETPPNTAVWSQFVDGIQYEGEYVSATAYQRNDIVKYGGVVYIAKVDTASNLPTNTAFWDKLVDGVSPQGVYNAGRSYKPNDVVAYGSSLYYSLTNSTGNLPTVTAFWAKFVDGISPQGVYSNTKAYVPNDLVAYGANLYYCLTESTGNLPTSVAFWSLYISGSSFKGIYSAATAYKIGESVTFGANLYVAKADTLAGDLPTGTKFDLVTPGFRARGDWATATTYLPNDVVSYGGNSFISLVHQASSAFQTDLSANRWQKFNSGIRSRGAWATGTVYLQDDLVSNGISTFIVLSEYTAGVSVNADVAAGRLSVLASGATGVPLTSPANNNFLLASTDLGPVWRQPRMRDIFTANERNQGSDFTRPRRVGNRHYAGDGAATALTAITPSVSHIIAIPFCVTKPTPLSTIGVSITAVSASGASPVKYGLCASIEDANGNVIPGNFLVQGTSVVSVAADFSVSTDTTLFVGEVFWLVFCHITFPHTMRATAVASQYPAFGRAAGTTSGRVALSDTSGSRPGVNYTSTGNLVTSGTFGAEPWSDFIGVCGAPFLTMA